VLALVPSLVGLIWSVLPSPVVPLAGKPDPAQVIALAAQMFGRAFGFGSMFLCTTFVTWGMWVGFFRLLARGEPATLSSAARAAPWGDCVRTFFAFLLIPLAVFAGMMVSMFALALVFSVAKLVGNSFAFVATTICSAVVFVFFACNMTLMSLQGPVLVMTETSGLRALEVAVRRAYANAPSLLGLFALIVAMGLVLVAGGLALELVVHGEVAPAFLAFFRAPSASGFQHLSSLLMAEKSFSVIRLAYTFAWPVFTAYLSTLFVTWFAGTEHA
jgi:hypothetical protein